MDGFEFLAEIRGTTRRADIPVVVVTAKTMNAEAHARLQGHVEGIVTKNREPIEDLLADLSKLVISYVRDSLV